MDTQERNRIVTDLIPRIKHIINKVKKQNSDRGDIIEFDDMLNSAVVRLIEEIEKRETKIPPLWFTVFGSAAELFRNHFGDKRYLCHKRIDTEYQEGISSKEDIKEDFLLQIRLFKEINKLRNDSKCVIIARYFYDYDDKEIAFNMGLSVGRISQIGKQALQTLRKEIGYE